MRSHLAEWLVRGEISPTPEHRRRDRMVTEMILVVDDEPSIRRFAARALLEEGFPVREAADGAQALEMVHAGGVSVLVSDVVMPRLNGVQLMEALARSHPQLPVLLMSGYAAPELEGMGIAAPCGLLTKPFSAEQLVEEVRRCLGRAGPLALARGADA
jgi:two-component system cell cycle sensor histidine kinase/response regulator CckA